MIDGSGGHFVGKQMPGVQRSHGAVFAKGAIQNDLVTMQIGIGEDAAVVMRDRPGLAMLVRRDREGRNALQPEPILSAPAERGITTEESDGRFAGSVLRLLDRAARLGIGQREHDRDRLRRR